MASAPSAIAASKATIVCSGASADAPPCAITRGRRSIVSVTTSVAPSSRGHARPERSPPVHPSRGAPLLADPPRGDGAHSRRRTAHHRSEPRDLRRSRPHLYSHSLRRALYGLGRPVPDTRLLVAHSPSARFSRPDRLGRPAFDAGGGATASVRPRGDDLSRRGARTGRTAPAIPSRRFSPRLLAQGARAACHHRGWPRLLATRPHAAETWEAPHHLSSHRLTPGRGGPSRGRAHAGREGPGRDRRRPAPSGSA